MGSLGGPRQDASSRGTQVITFHSVVAAKATVGLVGREGILISRTIMPMTHYLVFAGSLGLLFAYVLLQGTF